MKLPEYNFSNYIFVVTGMSYITDSSGTSKVVKAHEDIFREKKIGYIVVFPISRSRGEGVKWRCITTGCYGFTINGQFVGVMTANEVLNTVLELQNLEKKCLGILIHHLIRNKFSEIEWMISKIENVPVIFYLHDFYTCCVNPNLMKNDRESCIDRNVSCDGCCYKQKKQEHIYKIKNFFKTFEDRLTFVAPSDYTKQHWIMFYPEYANNIIVISHQKLIGKYYGNKEMIFSGEPLRLAFVGAQKQIKGWNIFKKIVTESRKMNCNYDFYYFGNGTEKLDGVKNINVDIATQGKDAMTESLRKNLIAAVFLVCVCGETYSYTTYESNAANCFIFAMSSGGNIPYTVKKNNWGLVFSTEEDLINEILDEQKMRITINNWKVNSSPGATSYQDNDEIAKIFINSCYAKIEWKSKSSSILHRIKRFALNKIFILSRINN